MKNLQLRSMAVVAVALLFTCLASAAHAATYTFFDLGAGQAFGLNNSGQVVGQDYNSSNPYNFHTGTTIPGGGYAYGINNSGTMVGTTGLDGFIYNGSTQLLGASVNAVSNNGQYAGQTATQAFVYNGTSMTLLGTLGNDPNSAAYGINSSGHAVGASYDNNGRPTAFIYNGAMTSLGGGTAFGINNSGLVVGGMDASSNTTRAFLYNGTMVDLGTFGGDNSLAYAINNLGAAVGYADVSPDSNISHAFLYQNGAMTDLSALLGADSPWLYLEVASAINDLGQIAGWGYLKGDDTATPHAFLATAAVPVPGAVWLLGSGLLGLAGLKRKYLG